MKHARVVDRVAAVAVVVVSCLFAISPRQAAGADAGYRVAGDRLVLENAFARFELGLGFRGSLVGLVETRSEVDLLAGLPYPIALFALDVVGPGCDVHQLHNLTPSAFSYRGERLSGAVRLILSYTAIDGRPLDVTVSITLADDSALASWRIDVDNRDPGTTLRSVVFPAVLMPARLGADADDDAVAFPLLDGVVVHEPEAAFTPGQGLVATWPADLSLQMAAVYDRRAGLYLGHHEAGTETRTFGVTRVEPEGVPALGLQVATSVSELPATSVSSTAVMGPYVGDWYDAATIYRKATASRIDRPPPLALRTDVPAWWSSCRPVVTAAAWSDGGDPLLPAAVWPQRVAAWKGRLGFAPTLLMFAWEHNGAWTGPGFYPPRDGSAAFRTAMNTLGADGGHGYVYLSGSVWRLTRRELPGYDDHAAFDAIGRPSAVLTCDGAVHLDPFYESIGWSSARMCPSTAFWRDTVADAVAHAAALGVDAVSVDEFPIGSIVPCFATDHGHPPGSGAWQGAAWRQVLQLVRQRAREIDPRLALTSEEPNELYLDLLDGYVSRHNLPDGFLNAGLLRLLGDRLELAPIFASVYHDVTTSVAEAVDLTPPPGEPGLLNTSRAWGLAAAVVLGSRPAATGISPDDADPALLDLFLRTSRLAAGSARRYVVGGRMLRPPSLDSPALTFAWLDFDLVTGAFEVRQRSAPSVLASAWRAADGRRGILVANLAGSAQSVTVPLDSAADLATARITLELDGLRTTLHDGGPPPATVEVEIPSWGIVLIEVEPASWRIPSSVRPTALPRDAASRR